MHLVETNETADTRERKELMEKRRRFQLARLITLSEEMLDLARLGDWERLEEMETLRRVELDECFSMQAEQPSLLIAQALATLVHINDQIVCLVRMARDKVSSEQRREHASLKAADAYQQQAPDRAVRE